MKMTVSEAQADMRRGYCSGGAGILASALAWSIAAAVSIFSSAEQAVWALLIGGMLIHPTAVLICKVLGASGTHTKGNPFGSLAGSSTVWMILCIPLAYFLGLNQVDWFFPAMLLIIGGRYLVFATLYGMNLYWALGFALAGAGIGLGYFAAPAQLSTSIGAAVEALFAAVALVQNRRSVRTSTTAKSAA